MGPGKDEPGKTVSSETVPSEPDDRGALLPEPPAAARHPDGRDGASVMCRAQVVCRKGRVVRRKIRGVRSDPGTAGSVALGFRPGAMHPIPVFASSFSDSRNPSFGLMLYSGGSIATSRPLGL
jgi:hypothetical protein